jgi:hypothetical protein
MLEPLLTYDRFTPPIEYRNGVDPNDQRVKRRVQLIEQVPDQIQQIIAHNGGYIVFFNGRITDQKEFEHKRGKAARNHAQGTWDDLPGGHNPSMKAVLIGIEGNYPYGQSENDALHEYGHGFDDGIGKRLLGVSLSDTFTVLETVAKAARIPNPYNLHPREFAAYAVTQYYKSRADRMTFETSFPKMAKLLRAMEYEASMLFMSYFPEKHSS